MKTRVLTILAAMLFMGLSGFAKDPTTTMESQIRAKIEYPATAVEKQLQGVVYVEFTVKDNGAVEVTNCFSTEGELQSYIFGRFTEITVNPDPEITGK